MFLLLVLCVTTCIYQHVFLNNGNVFDKHIYIQQSVKYRAGKVVYEDDRWRMLVVFLSP